MKINPLMAVGVAAALLLAGCGGGTGSTSGSATMTVGTGDRGDSLDSASAYVGWSNSRDGIVETLVDVDEHLNLVPELATSWENTDPTTWVITLRDGVTFHNGAPMDAAAVKASLEHAIATNVRAQAQMPIASMTPEGNKLTIVTSMPLAALPNILTDPMTGIQAVGDGINPATDPQGTGPFQVSEFVPHERLELDAYPGYWGGEPKLSHVTVRSYADLQALGLAMQSGEVQVAVQPEAAGLSVFSDTSEFTTWDVTSTRAEAVIMNTASPVTSDPKVREAVNWAIDREAYVSLMHGMGVASYNLFSPDIAFGKTDGLNIPVDKKDLAKAKQLLLEAGYTESDGMLVKDGQPLVLRLLTYPKRPQLGQMAQLLQSDLGSIGAKVEISELTSTTDQMVAGEFELGMYSMAMVPTGDSQYFFETMLRSGSTSNYSHYNSPQFDAALDTLGATFGAEERAKQTQALTQMVHNDMPYVVFGHSKWWVISTAAVKDLSLRPTEYHLLDHRTHVG